MRMKGENEGKGAMVNTCNWEVQSRQEDVKNSVGTYALQCS